MAGSRKHRRRRRHKARGPWRLRGFRIVPPRVASLSSFVLSSPHAASRLLRSRVRLASGHLLLVGLFSRHWAAPWPSCSALLSLCSLFRPRSAGTPLSPPRSGTTWAPRLGGRVSNFLSGVYSRALGPGVAASCPSLLERRYRGTHFFSHPSLWSLRATAPDRTGLFVACTGSPLFWLLLGLVPPCAPVPAIVFCPRHCPSCFALHSLLHHAFLSSLSASPPLRHGRCPCFVPLPLFLPSCRRGFAAVRSGRAPHSVALVTAPTRTPLCPGLLPRPSVSPAPFLGAPHRAHWRVLPRPRRTGVPRAPLPPLAHALAAPPGSPHNAPNGAPHGVQSRGVFGKGGLLAMSSPPIAKP